MLRIRVVPVAKAATTAMVGTASGVSDISTSTACRSRPLTAADPSSKTGRSPFFKNPDLFQISLKRIRLDMGHTDLLSGNGAGGPEITGIGQVRLHHMVSRMYCCPPGT